MSALIWSVAVIVALALVVICVVLRPSAYQSKHGNDPRPILTSIRRAMRRA